MNTILDCTVTTRCPFCGKSNDVKVNEMDYLDWLDGKLAQKAFPYLSADEREMLISGICPACWDSTFGSDEEPDPDEVDIHGNTFGDDEEEENEKNEEDSEMEKLMSALTAYNIPYETTIDCTGEGLQVWYPSRDDNICDVICHKYSYGGSEGLLEMMGLVPDDWGDSVQGYLTAEEVFGRIHANYFGTV